MIHLHRPVITATDRASVDAVLADPHSGASVVRDLESALCDLTGYPYAVACSSATIGLWAAIKAVSDRTFFYTSALSFAATWNAIRMTGATLHLEDVNTDGWVVNPDQNPDAFVGVELNGSPCELGAVMDSACALSRGMGEDCETPAVVSFNASKTITGLGGGAVLCSTEDTSEVVRSLLDQGKRAGDATQPGIFGTNGRIPYPCAALALSQLHRFDQIKQRKGEIHTRYREKLHGVTWQVMNPADCWLSMPMLPSGRQAETALRKLTEAGIEARRMYQVPDAVSPKRAPVAHKIARRAIQLPAGLDVTDADVDRICEIVQGVV